MNIPVPQIEIRHPSFHATQMYLKEGVPESVEEALRFNNHVRTGEYSVTELLDHPRCARLKRLHPEAQMEDVSKVVHSMVGSAVHKWLEDHIPEDGSRVKEYRVMIPEDIVGANVSGSIDLVEGIELNGNPAIVIRDFKNFTTYKYIQRDFKDVIWQLNMYNLGLSMDVETRWPLTASLTMVVFFRDWTKMKNLQMGFSYPPAPIMTLAFRPFPIESVIEFVKGRVALHKSIVDIPEPEWPDADDEHTWNKTDKFRVVRQGKTRAISGGVFQVKDYNTIEEAEEAANKLAAMKGDCEVLRNEGGRKRCEEYCPVAEHCTTYQNYLKEKSND